MRFTRKGQTRYDLGQEESAMAIELEYKLPHAVNDVWQIISDPGRIDWVAGVASCEFDGQVRRFKMDGAGDLAEQIFSVDHDTHTISYGVIESTPPLASHRASMALSAAPEGTLLTWRTAVEPAAVAPFIKQGMDASAAKLLEVLAK